MSASLRVLGSVALMAVAVSCKQLNLNFDDLIVSNDGGCANVTLTQEGRYQGVAVSSSFIGNVAVLNTTKTPACNSAKDEKLSLSPFGLATSSSNVGFFPTGELEAQIIIPFGVALINAASVDATPIFIQDEINSGNVTVRFDTLQSDFGAVDIRKSFTFHTATDGWGPYHLTSTTNGVSYQFFEAEATIGPFGKDQSFRHPAVFFDSLVLESTE